MQPLKEDRYVMRGALGSAPDRNTEHTKASSHCTHGHVASRRHHHQQHEHAIFSAISPPSLLPSPLYVTKPFLFTAAAAAAVVDARWQRRCCQVMHATKKNKRKKKKKKKTRSSSRAVRSERTGEHHGISGSVSIYYGRSARHMPRGPAGRRES